MQPSSSHSSSAPGSPWEQSSRLDIHRLDQAVQRFYQAALTTSTHKTYKAAERKYLSFCTKFSLPPYLPQKTFYAILQPVWDKRAWQAPPYTHIYPVSVRFKFQLASLTHELITCPGFAKSLRVLEFRQSRMAELLSLAFPLPLPSSTSSAKFG